MMVREDEPVNTDFGWDLFACGDRLKASLIEAHCCDILGFGTVNRLKKCFTRAILPPELPIDGVAALLESVPRDGGDQCAAGPVATRLGSHIKIANPQAPLRG